MNITNKSAPACHFLVKKLCVEMAQTTYERLASQSNGFFAANPKSKRWVENSWPIFIEEARATLAQMLERPLPESLKETIHDALIKDARLLHARPARINSVLRTMGSGALPTARLEDLK